jgi:RNA polymerase sigma-70 factor, ECF subfamily
LAAKQQQQYIQELLLRLTTEQREALLLRYYQGLNYEDIAAVLGVSLSSAKMRVSRGLARLREMVDDSV